VKYRYETRIAQARREARLGLWTHVFVGLFLCLTIIGAPLGVVVMVVGLVEHSRSSSAIAAAEHDARTRAIAAEEWASIRAYKRL
jgi:hypothetical protein